MVNPEWGIKRTCHSCGAKYYDFKKKAPSCPSCGAALDPEALLKSRRRGIPEEKPKPAPAKVVEEVEVEDVAEEDGEDDAVLENTDDLGDDEDDVDVEAEDDEEGEEV